MAEAARKERPGTNGYDAPLVRSALAQLAGNWVVAENTLLSHGLIEQTVWRAPQQP